VPAHLAKDDGQDLRLSRTVIGEQPPQRWRTPYVGRFACDWHRLVGLVRAGVRPGVDRDVSGP